MEAIIEESGGQRKVQDGEVILVDLYKGGEAGVGESITFDRVLVVGEAGGEATVGRLYGMTMQSSRRDVGGRCTAAARIGCRASWGGFSD